MKNKKMVMAGIVLSLVLLASCGPRTERGVMESETTRSTSERVNSSTAPNRGNTNTANSTRTTTTTDPVNTTSASNRVNQNATQNRANTTVTNPANAPVENRIIESTTTKQHLDDNANISRRNENTETIDRKELRDDMHNATKDDIVQKKATENWRTVLYSHLNMTQDQIQQLETMERNHINPISQTTPSESAVDRQKRIDGYFKEILNEEQFARFERWKRDNPNTRF